MNTSYYDKGSLVSERVEIIINYFEGEMWLDIFSFLPSFIFFEIEKANNSYYPLLLVFLKFSRFKRIVKKIKERFYHNKKFTHILSLA